MHGPQSAETRVADGHTKFQARLAAMAPKTSNTRKTKLECGRYKRGLFTNFRR